MNKKETISLGLKRAIETCNEKYDDSVGLMADVGNGTDYHSSVKEGSINYPVLDNLDYAVALIDTDDLSNIDRALSIIDKVIDAQDKDEKSECYGVWSRYFNEALEDMTVPDWNRAAFNGRVLLYLLIDYRQKLSDSLVSRIEESIEHAANSIVRRNMGPDYSNINLMGAYVTIKAGELLNNEVYFEFGKMRLKKELDFITKNGMFTEYNSPAYTILALEEIGRMIKYFKDSECLDIASKMNEIAWKCIAEHYHPKTEQLAAPHSRCYRSIASRQFNTFIHIGTNASKNLVSIEDISIEIMWAFVHIECPEDYYEYFEPIETKRIVSEKFYKGYDTTTDNEIRVNVEKNMHELEAYTYLNPHFSLGSFIKYDFWNQRRPLMAYWGEANHVTVFRVRCLHDGYDYCSAMLTSMQHENHIIAGVNFVKDHGDSHFILSPLENGTITARNLLIRFELSGAIKDSNITLKQSTEDTIDISSNGINTKIVILHKVFDTEKVKFKQGSDGNRQWVDLVLYEGESKKIDFNEIVEAGILFGISIYDGDVCIDDRNVKYDCSYIKTKHTVTGGMNINKIKKQVALNLRPGAYLGENDNKLVKKNKCGGFVYE